MDHNSEILNEIEWLLKELSAKLSEADRRGGWTENKQAKYKLFFEKIKSDVCAGQFSLYKARPGSITRTLDSSGISRGPMADQAAKIGLLLCELRNSGDTSLNLE